MATLTIRDLDDDLKQSLRVRAALLNRSMEEEARQILRAALSGPPPGGGSALVDRIRARVAPLGGVDLAIPEREPVRPPPEFAARRAKASPAGRARKPR
jgi:plasmid stability protein